MFHSLIWQHIDVFFLDVFLFMADKKIKLLNTDSFSSPLLPDICYLYDLYVIIVKTVIFCTVTIILILLYYIKSINDRS